MSFSTVTDVNLVAFQTKYISINNDKQYQLWLMTSPEYHMKRLLSAYGKPIYQICHSFRNSELGKYHNPEFTMLEWYQPNYSMHNFIHEIDNLLQIILCCKKSTIISYQNLFKKYLNIDPLSTNLKELRKKSKELKIDYLTNKENDLDKLIEIFFLLIIEPFLGKNEPIFVYHFPIAQASLAAINTEDQRVSDRFEIFFKGIELGNGFYELTDFYEQKKRFLEDNKKRLSLNLPQRDIDKNLLNALEYGLPPSSGVAIGLDRLIMLALNKSSISKIMAFSFDNC